jgi:putative membrane protein
VALCVGAVLYALGVGRLWTGVRRGVSVLEVTSFAAGWLCVALALMSPIDSVSDDLFSAHMVQHELLMVVAAPLLIMGRVVLVTLWGLPRGGRRMVGRILSVSPIRQVRRAIVRPLEASLIHALAIWGWHVPFLFQAAVRNDVVHACQHFAFLITAMLFWSAMLHPHRTAMRGMAILYLFATAVHTSALGALLTFARSPWYPIYGDSAARWGLTPIADQQLAGLIMWIPAGVVYMIAALITMKMWLRDSEWQGRSAGHAAVAP